MNRVCSIFSQILRLFPRGEFEQIVNKHRGDRHARGFTCWGQFVAMLFCQLARAHSLREICQGLAACEGKLKHLGLNDSPKVSTLAYVNGHPLCCPVGPERNIGTSEKAVLTQIWTALIVMLRWLKLNARHSWSLSNLLALLRQQLFVYRELYQWPDNPFTGPPALEASGQQLALELT